MEAALKDGHGNVQFTSEKPRRPVPIVATWIEDKYIVTAGSCLVSPGGEIVAINGLPAAKLLAELEGEISAATPQWARYRAASLPLFPPRGAQLSLTFRSPGAAESRQVTVMNDSPLSRVGESRPANPVAELEPGMVFDVRGYPKMSPAWFSHVSKTPLKSAQWHIPLVDRPGHMEFTRSGEWNLQPKAPYLEAKKVFLTDGGPIGDAESTMGIVEFYKLGEIVGETTAGTNGNINPFQLPGGYNVVWTGMKVIKHDGTRHHGAGTKPTISMTRTQAGVAAGRDEVLERGIALLKLK